LAEKNTFIINRFQNIFLGSIEGNSLISELYWKESVFMMMGAED